MDAAGPPGLESDGNRGRPNPDSGSRLKLQKLAELLPEGVVAPTPWLIAQGFSSQLLLKYVRRGWLERQGSRAVARPGRLVDVDGLLLGLQRFTETDFHVGGLTALNRLGQAHYLPLGAQLQVHLWGRGELPKWARDFPLPEKLLAHGDKLFSSESARSGIEELPTKLPGWNLRVSGVERAILEVLSLVDKTEASFMHAAELFEGLTVVRVPLVNELLATCRNVQAKRLFLLLADRQRHVWAANLARSAVDLGKGKRQLVEGGRMDPLYKITVPARFGVET